MEWVELLGRRALGDCQFFKCKVIEWAIDQVKQGKSGMYLYLLAGMSEQDSYVEIGGNFERACKELDVELLDEQAIDIYAIWVCQQILDEILDLREGHQRLYEIWETLTHSGISYSSSNSGSYTRWMYLWDSLELISTENFSLVEGLTLENYPEFIRREARDFIEELTQSKR